MMANAKISELPAATALAGDELLPGVQDAGNVAVTADQLRSHALLGVPPLVSRPFVQLWADGDSKAMEPINGAAWVLAKEPMEVYTGRSFGIGGSGTGTTTSPNGLLVPARMAVIVAALEAAVAAGTIVDVVLTAGTNDAGNGTISPEEAIANIRAYHNALRAAGLRYLLLMSIDPRVGSSGAAIVSANRAYADYCETVPDAIFVDTTPWLLDPASTTHSPIGADTGAVWSVTADGLHCSPYGCYRKQFALSPILRTLYRPRAFEGISKVSIYNASTSPRGNILGTNGRFTTIGGTDSYTKNDTSSVTGTPPASFTASGTLSGDVALTYSVEDCAALGDYFGGDWPCVRVALAGTPTANATIQLAGRFVSFPQADSTPMIGRAIFACNALAGTRGFRLASQNVTPPVNQSLGASGSVNPSDQLPALDGLFSLDFFTVPTSNINSGLNFQLNIMSGVELSGSIDLIGIEWRPWPAVPAAS